MQFAFLLAFVAPLLMVQSVHAEFVDWSVTYIFDLDLTDLNNVRNNFGAGESGSAGDFDQNGLVDLRDLNFVRNNFGITPQLIWDSLTPTKPTSDDVINFTLVYGFDGDVCYAQRATGGAPYLIVNHAESAVEVAFDPNSEPIMCAGDSPHVQGIDGEFGPLAAGNWTLGIAGEAPRIEFQVSEATAVPEPNSAVLMGMAAVSAFVGAVRRTRGS